MKRIILFVLIAILALSACTPKAGGTAGTNADEKITIRYGIWENLQMPAHRQMADEFTKLHPNITIVIEVVPWSDYWTKLQTSVAGGDAWDVYWLNAPNFAGYVGKNAIMDLTPLIARDNVDMSVFPNSLVSMYSKDGKNYGMPKDFDTIGLFYNKKMFDDAGMKYPDETWTWDDLKAAAKKLTTKDTWGFASLNTYQSGYGNFIFQNGGRFIDPATNKATLDMPETCEALKYYEGFITDGTSPDSATMTASDPEAQLFPGGKVAMLIDGSWMAKSLSELEFPVGVTVLPQGKQRATVIHGLGNVVSSTTKYPEAAWEWVKFLSTEQAQKIAAETGAVIPAYKGLSDLWVKSVPTLDTKIFIDELAYAHPLEVFAGGKNAEAQDAILKVLEEAWLGNITMDEACKQATEKANAILAP